MENVCSTCCHVGWHDPDCEFFSERRGGERRINTFIYDGGMCNQMDITLRSGKDRRALKSPHTKT